MSYLSHVTAGLLDAGFSPSDVQKISDVISIISADYDITPRETALTAFDDSDNISLAKMFAATKTLEGKSPKTVQAYVSELKVFSRTIRKNFRDAKSNDIRYYLALKLQKGCKNSSVENARAYISSFFKWAADEDIISKNPCATIKPIKIKQEIRMPFSQTELDRLRSACRNEKERALVEFLLSTGARINEVAQMEVCDVDISALTAHVREGKGGKERIVLMTEVAAMHLKAYLIARNDESTVLFANRQGGICSTNSFRKALNVIAKRAGVENVHPHRFRRTLATTLSMRGMPIEQIQKLLGHSNINTTMKYVNVDSQNVATSYHQCA